MSKGKVYVKLDERAVGELLKSSEAMSMLRSYGDKVASRCGPGYEADGGSVGSSRARVTVRAVTKEAQQDNLDNNTLEKARGTSYD